MVTIQRVKVGNPLTTQAPTVNCRVPRYCTLGCQVGPHMVRRSGARVTHRERLIMGRSSATGRDPLREVQGGGMVSEGVGKLKACTVKSYPAVSAHVSERIISTCTKLPYYV